MWPTILRGLWVGGRAAATHLLTWGPLYWKAFQEYDRIIGSSGTKPSTPTDQLAQIWRAFGTAAADERNVSRGVVNLFALADQTLMMIGALDDAVLQDAEAKVCAAAWSKGQRGYCLHLFADLLNRMRDTEHSDRLDTLKGSGDANARFDGTRRPN